MGCCGEREKPSPLQSQKWEYITLSDFRATSILNYLTYAWLWIMAMVGVAVYAADTFTAVNLLVFDKWSSQIKPAVPIKYSKWIFAACILFSWLLVLFEWIRAIRVIRRGGVAESYMDYLAANAQSMRSQGWKRFLVFSELTKSKKRIDYVAFFIYFTFKSAIRVIIAEGPRQVINALTLYSVMDAEDLVHGVSVEGQSPWGTFWSNIEHIAETNTEEAVILFSMLFTLILWVISALCLILALVLYLVFMWHYIPQRDGRLYKYVRRKIDKRLEKIVEKKVQAAIEDEERKRRKMEAKIAKKEDRPLQPVRQPTLPQMGPSPDLKRGDGKLPEFGISRQDTSTTVSTLPLYSSQPPTRNGSSSSRVLQRQPTIPDLSEDRPPMPVLSGTERSVSTTASHDMNASLLDNAGYAGEPSIPPPAAAFGRPAPPPRSMTSTTQGSRRPYPPGPQGFGRGTPGPPRMITPMDRSASFQAQRDLPPGPSRAFTPFDRPGTSQSRRDLPSGPGRSFTPLGRPGTVQSQRSYERGPPQAYNPMMRNDTFPSQRSLPLGPPPRSNTFQSLSHDRYSEVSPISPTEFTGMQRFESPVSISPQEIPAQSYNATSGVPQRQYGSLHSHQSSFSRPGAYSARQQTKESTSSSNAPPTRSNHYPKTQQAGGPTSSLSHNEWNTQENSFEMTTSPASSIEKPKPVEGGYRAFSPAVFSSNSQTVHQGREPNVLPDPQASASIQQKPAQYQPNVIAYGPPGSNGNYFGRVIDTAPLQQPAAINASHVPSSVYSNPMSLESGGLMTPDRRTSSRAVSGYGDILDAYVGHSGTPSIYSPGIIDGVRSKSISPDFTKGR